MTINSTGNYTQTLGISATPNPANAGSVLNIAFSPPVTSGSDQLTINFGDGTSQTLTGALCGLLVAASDRQLHHPGTPARRRWKKGGPDHAIGRSRGGLSTKINALVNQDGLPLRIVLSAGQASDKAAVAELGRWYGLPTWGYAGCSDAKVMDEQAAVEATLSVVMAKLSGANLIHDVGYMESGLTGSFEMIALTDELVAMADHLMKGVAVSDDNLLVDEIDRVGPGGNYLDSDYTLNRFREFWFPGLRDRRRRQLGAAAAGDLGAHFPDSDPTWHNISSLVLLERIVAILKDRGYQPVNVDAAVVAEKPRLAPHLPDMVARLAPILGLTPEAVSVKATTTEKMGFAGREEGIAAYAVVLVEPLKAEQ